MNNTIKVIIVEDHAIFREGLKKVLERMNNVEVIGEAENGAVFLELLKDKVPDIVLMDINMPVMGGIEATEKALERHPNLKIIVLSMSGEEDYLYTMIISGISGYLLKNTSMNNLSRAILMVSEGEQYFSPELNGKLAKRLKQYNSVEIPQLTPKETEVIRMLAKGLNTEEIANKLFISKRTVEAHRASLLQKTDSSNTINLLIYAIQNKLIILDELGNRRKKEQNG
jgi:DNA-binding NarL/FixJ family response regulator